MLNYKQYRKYKKEIEKKYDVKLNLNISFHLSLITYYDKYKNLTEKQLDCLRNPKFISNYQSSYDASYNDSWYNSMDIDMAGAMGADGW